MRAICLSLLFMLPASVVAQSSVGGSFVVTKEPVKDGIRVTSDLPASQHHRNVGGSDGAGLCVYTSFWHSALWQSVSDVYGFRAYMERRPGGSWPDKFEKTLAAYCKEKGVPCPGYTMHTGGDIDFLKMALKTGRMVCITYCGVDGSGRYGGEVIGHMVNLVYLDDSQACILDNNFPGTFLWMSANDLICRWRGVQPDGRPFMARNGARSMPVGGGWAIVLLPAPPAPYPATPAIQFNDKKCGCKECKCPDDVCPNCTISNDVAGCTCGEYCKCKDKCPQCCPVIFGQCANGRCPLPQQSPSRVMPFTPPNSGSNIPFYPKPETGQWVPSGNGKEWGYWVNGKRVAAAFADGRCESTDANGIATGKVINPPATLPNGIAPKLPADAPKAVQATEPPADQFPQGGVSSEKLTSDRRWYVNGQCVSKEEAHAALTLVDDSNRWNLSVVGDPGFQRTVKDDVARLHGDMMNKLHIQTYSPDAWQVSQFRLSPGITLRKPAVNRVGADVGVIPAGDYVPTKLGDLLSADGGPTPRPAPVPSPKPKEPEVPKVDPIPVPTPMPPPQPQPQPTPKPAGGGKTLLMLLVLGFIGYYLWRK